MRVCKPILARQADRTWKSSLMRSRGAVAVRATAPAAPPATNILYVARRHVNSQQDCVSAGAGSLRLADRICLAGR